MTSSHTYNGVTGQDLAKSLYAVSVGQQAALLSAAKLVGVTPRAPAANEPLFRRLLNRVLHITGRHIRRHRPPTPEESLPILADAIIGTAKTTIFSVLGPPRAAVVNEPKSSRSRPSCWQSDTWYYPLPRLGAAAMAISFDDGFANEVEFLKTPFMAR